MNFKQRNCHQEHHPGQYNALVQTHTSVHCPECGAVLPPGGACVELFHQMLFWENERPENGTVHYLAVLCYHLQHSSLYSPEGLAQAQGLLAAFVEHGASTDTVLQQSRRSLDSGRRTWKITARPGQAGAYPTPPRWTMTASDVIAGGIENYPETVCAWARSIWQALNL